MIKYVDCFTAGYVDNWVNMGYYCGSWSVIYESFFNNTLVVRI